MSQTGSRASVRCAISTIPALSVTGSPLRPNCAILTPCLRSLRNLRRSSTFTAIDERAEHAWLAKKTLTDGLCGVGRRVDGKHCDDMRRPVLGNVSAAIEEHGLLLKGADDSNDRRLVDRRAEAGDDGGAARRPRIVERSELAVDSRGRRSCYLFRRRVGRLV